MSYDVTVRKSTIRIKKELVKSALESIHDYMETHKLAYCSKFNIEDIYFDNYNFYEEDEDSLGVIEVFYEYLNLDCDYDEEYLYIDTLRYEGLGDEKNIFNIIAEFCEDGSYMEFCGEDGDLFRYTIKGNACVSQQPKLIWE